MKIAVEGCTHGELDKIYETVADIEKREGYKIDLLISCGDFQSTRNLPDLKCMSVPDKYKEMGSFYKYYSGEKIAPVLTLFIGGNHEASNHLQELPFGGWVAPNIYYMGYAGVVDINGLRIGGLSGIFKGYEYNKGHFESAPYTPDTIKSVYHIRQSDVFRLRQLEQNPPHVMLSHDWPRGVTDYGDVDQLLRFKKHFREDIQNNRLGSGPTMEILMKLKPDYWFSAHLHCKFAALVKHDDEQQTKFLALDKCLPNRRFLQVLDIGKEISADQQVTLSYDKDWLAILKSTNHLTSVSEGKEYVPGPGYPGRYNFKPTEEELQEIDEIFKGDFKIPFNFEKNVEPFDPQSQSMKDLYHTRLPDATKNRQTEDFCVKLGIDDPMTLLLKGQGSKHSFNTSSDLSDSVGGDSTKTFVSFNKDEIDLDDDDEDDNERKAEPVSEPKRSSLVLPTPKNEVQASPKQCDPEPEIGRDDANGSGAFVVDASPDVQNLHVEPVKKKLKRRNQAMYATLGDDE